MRARLWTPEECRTAARIFRETSSFAGIARVLGRSSGAVWNRYNEHGETFVTKAQFSLVRGSPREKPDEAAIADRDAIMALDPVSTTAALLGDPLPGRSALDRMLAQQSQTRLRTVEPALSLVEDAPRSPTQSIDTARAHYSSEVR